MNTKIHTIVSPGRRNGKTMELGQGKEALIKWGKATGALIEEWEPEKQNDSPFGAMVHQASLRNSWFTKENIIRALKQFVAMLEPDAFNKWINNYNITETDPKNIGLVPAGNIPGVGFHDIVCILATGNKLIVRFSASDNVILPFLLNILTSIEPGFNKHIELVERMPKVDAVIATGSNNTSRYFEYYFRNIPHVIRRNRNSIAVLTGNETKSQLDALREDVFSFFGLGCRNVSHLFVPHDYDFRLFFESMEAASYVMQHNKYMNNFDYNQAIYLLNKEPYLTNNFLIIREAPQLSTPVSVINYTRYHDLSEAENQIESMQDDIQCRVGVNGLPFGTTQQTTLSDYADRVDIMQFILNL